MSYMSKLDDLLTLLQGRAIEPSTAVNSVWEMQDAAKQRRLAEQQAQQQAQQDALSSLQKYALEGAGTPTTLQDVMRLSQAEATFPTNPQSALDMLFLPATGRNKGLSRIDPTLPTGDEQDIFNIVRDEYAAGNIDPDSIYREVENALGYGPKTMGRLSPDIDPIFQKALEAARGY